MKYLVVHVLTTCDEQGVYVTRDSTEIIEVAWTTVSPDSISPIQSTLVRPVNTPITPLCTQLTSITWETASSGVLLQQAIAQFAASGAADEGTVYVCLDSWDLRVQLERESRDKGVKLPPVMAHPRVFDLAKEWEKWATQKGMVPATPTPLIQICNSLDVLPPTSPRAKDMVTTVASCLHKLMHVAPAREFPTVLTRPLDVEADLRAFLTGGCKVLHLENLPLDTTQSELESWFIQHGGRPIGFWTMRTPEQHKPTGFGFAMFASHEEAVEALALNGRALNDKVVEVSPSSEQVIERAQDLLTPFPPSKNRPRPGDWTCQVCGFSNFQRRTACFRCNEAIGVGGHNGNMGGAQNGYQNANPGNNGGYQNSNGGGYQNGNHGNGGGYQNGYHGNHSNHGNHGGNRSVPFRAGDWKCGKNGCSYHNFAKNVACLKCGASRGEAAVVADANYVRFYGTPGMGQGMGLGMGQNYNQYQGYGYKDVNT
ncbi:hypothetical protein B0I72DRAFT_132174 [Yarrowia lipolytica]|jgi:hypothetical protein|uniref:YALI0F21835p n=2 Tax=Yarrowia lipolytica TaxID=4952 RepID=Q6C0T8_YARLI|nr:YALI0F21835p [Yarrowia lipolytica CLIB122]AOW07536.1 hypothetical protein YALI1_F28897g [Yarrowia lipolytica]KAB8281287.1 hypothetical protein BKA91DRAFT_140383 [Yarrowia lipolytica]KAE8170611.1 hypothetical protein BKA90DRAFT_140601 [Yarrowia lipolytica]KAJ8055394.1 hypothetical protein LXG23DRAFT_35047 [Yarrowia lipolytica]QNP99763.1 Putative RNA-binding protein [Yarrowia lipolytica]|eukprot:XP_505724.1 YALI0F21835p [Yarrowia lipolytica CLIB122]